MAGNQTPRIRIVPNYSDTLGVIASEFMNSYGLHLDEWQENILQDWLAVDEQGKYASSICGLSVPRQNGKTANVKARCISGICLFNEQILYTAHEVKTARKTFDEIADMFSNTAEYQELCDQVDYIRRANGQEEIKLLDWQDENGDWQPGGRIVFSARSRGAARGFTCDVLVCDEAQELTSEQMAALMPVISAGRNQNPQTILIGTPPSPLCSAEVFAATRMQALNGMTKGACWHEWSVEKITTNDDWSNVEMTNPALDKRLMRSAVEAEMAAMPSDFFARERLGYWSENTVAAVIDSQQWSACVTDEPPEDGVLCYSVKFSPDGSTGSLAVCLKPDSGFPHVELVAIRNMNAGISWFVEWLCSRADKPAQIVVDGMANSQNLVDELLRGGIKQKILIKPRASDVSSACSSFLNAVKEVKVTHNNQQLLNESATKSKHRNIGSNGGWGFADNGCTSTAIEAAALAYWAAINTKRNPNRKTRVCF